MEKGLSSTSYRSLQPKFLTHDFLMEGGHQPFCDDCLVSLTFKHIVLECPNYIERMTCFNNVNITVKYMVFRTLNIFGKL